MYIFVHHGYIKNEYVVSYPTIHSKHAFLINGKLELISVFVTSIK